jgi:hypothetical protein
LYSEILVSFEYNLADFEILDRLALRAGGGTESPMCCLTGTV